MTTGAEKKQKNKKNGTHNSNQKLTDTAGKEAFDWEKEFLRLCTLAQRMFHQLEQDIDALEPLPQNAATRKSALTERQGILASVAKLIQLFSELINVQQQLQKWTGGEEEFLPMSESDLEVIEQYFKKCREMGVPLLGSTNGK